MDTSVLDEIVENKKVEIRKAQSLVPLSEMMARCKGLERDVRDFNGSIMSGKRLGVIAEIKFASPSSGSIANQDDAIRIARAYGECDAVRAISVVTDAKYFGGSLGLLGEVRGIVKVPLLRKDFIIHKYQIYESYLAGADAVLLIASALESKTLKELAQLAGSFGMQCLVEAHNIEEVEKAVSAGAIMIGINSRDLGTFTIDKSLFQSLVQYIPDEVTKIAESGIENGSDARMVCDAGADAILVGTSLLKAADLAEKVNELAVER
ncbi:MAG: indole-3-glycerol phosphate synthase TrpC [Candidatus Micrarchaeota archaeon]|nr:indole-3-glycerol phosphate synthase TrpC [Candidatus Micrarchaeota archaeon]